MKNPKTSNQKIRVIDLTPDRIDVPKALLLDPDVIPRDFHMYAFIRDKSRSRVVTGEGDLLWTFQSQAEIGKELPQPITQQAVSQSCIRLMEASWIDMIKPGLSRSATIILLAYKGQIVPQRIRKMIGDSTHLKQVSYWIREQTQQA